MIVSISEVELFLLELESDTPNSLDSILEELEVAYA